MTRHSIIVNGHWRLTVASATLIKQQRRRIVAEVDAEFAARLQSAAWFQRGWLQIRMLCEIKRRMDREMMKIAPPKAFYAIR